MALAISLVLTEPPVPPEQALNVEGGYPDVAASLCMKAKGYAQSIADHLESCRGVPMTTFKSATECTGLKTQADLNNANACLLKASYARG